MRPDEDKIQTEVHDEFTKPMKVLAEDIVREANSHPEQPEGEKENLDTIKHLLKRMGLHQLVLENQAKRTNRWLLVLSFVMAVGSFFTVWQFLRDFKRALPNQAVERTGLGFAGGLTNQTPPTDASRR